MNEPQLLPAAYVPPPISSCPGAIFAGTWTQRFTPPALTGVTPVRSSVSTALPVYGLAGVVQTLLPMSRGFACPSAYTVPARPPAASSIRNAPIDSSMPCTGIV